MGGLHIYRNTRTGVSIETPCVCSGEDWEEVTLSVPPKISPKTETAPEALTGQKPTSKKTSRKK